MKNVWLAILALAFASTGALAYQNQGGNPGVVHDAQFKPVIKSAVAGVSDAIASGGEVLSYSAVNDGYTVTRVGTTSALGSGLLACVSKAAVATGDLAAHLCQTQGYAEVKWDATTVEWYRGDMLCANSVGAVVNCNAAGSHSGIISLENKNRGDSGAAMKVLIKLQ